MIKKTKKKQNDKKKKELFWKKPICYSVIIVVLAEIILHAVNTKTFKSIISYIGEKINFEYIQGLFLDLAYNIEPWINLSKLEFLKDFTELIPFVTVSFIAGFFHAMVFFENIRFRALLKIGIYSVILKILIAGIPYGPIAIIKFLPSFIAKYYYPAVFLLPLNFFALIAGSEIAIFIYRNFVGETIVSQYHKVS